MSLNIETAQNVYLEYEPAPIGSRVAAHLLDLLFRFIYIMILTIIIAAQKKAPAGWVSFILVMPILFYTLVFETYMKGQTPGKYIIKIKVAQIDGQESSFWNYLLRWLGGVVDFAVLGGVVAMIVIAVNKKGQRVGDILAGTSVVFIDKKSSLEQTGYIEVPEGYHPTFTNALFLTDRDVRIIASILARLKRDDSMYAYDLAYKAKHKLEQKIQQEDHIDMAADKFLETVLKDYNYLNSHQSKL